MSADAFSATLLMNAAGESTHRFGAGLIGVIAHPQGKTQRTAVVLFNAGLVQHAGPFRGYTQLSRVLAGSGFPVLRFDHGGLGDSEACIVSTAERRVLELRAALDLLSQQTGAERFVLGGICAGADEAFHASADPRIVGLLLLDGLAYRTKAFWVKHALPRLAKPSKLLHFLRRHSEGDGEANNDDYRDFPPQDEAVKQLETLVARDTRLLFLFTGGAYSYFNYAGQLADGFGPAAKAKQVTLEFWPDCDHTFYLQRDRERLQRLVVSWMRSQFAEPAPQ